MSERSEIVNTEMAAAWNGADGAEWVREAKRFDRAIAPYGEHLMRGAAITPTDRVLDIGCGNGASTRTAARAASSGSALGADLSEPMLALARATAEAEGLTNVTFEHADAQVHSFAAGVHDVTISRFGSMFFADPVAGFTNICRSMKPGGRLALVVWQDLGSNDWFRMLRTSFSLGRDLPVPPPNAPGPAGLADTDHTRSILERSGFGGVTFDALVEPFWVGSDVEDALGFARSSGPARGLLADVGDDDRARAFDALAGALAGHLGPDGVAVGSAAWLVVATRA